MDRAGSCHSILIDLHLVLIVIDKMPLIKHLRLSQDYTLTFPLLSDLFSFSSVKKLVVRVILNKKNINQGYLLIV